MQITVTPETDLDHISQLSLEGHFVLLSTSGQKYLETGYKVEELCATGTNHP